MIRGSIDSIESLGLYDGPGIRVVVFFNSCKLRCKYCHNPEMWVKQEDNITSTELVEKIIRYKNYVIDNGGVTFSGGEPLLQPDFLIDCCKKLKEEGFHIALDTAGVGIGKYDEILEHVDLVIFDVKHADTDGYKELTGLSIDESERFLDIANKKNKKFWVRQVVIPGVTDTDEYLIKLKQYLNKIHNIEKIEFLPYHKLGSEKYEALGIEYSYKDQEEMDKTKCEELYKKFINM
ncbi:MAG: pyruvate formate lyase-activating protein [Bacilli bacterium]|nr:pyruvate formate lyase-activating protein [Bacilli bacterium]